MAIRRQPLILSHTHIYNSSIIQTYVNLNCCQNHTCMFFIQMDFELRNVMLRYELILNLNTIIGWTCILLANLILHKSVHTLKEIQWFLCLYWCFEYVCTGVCMCICGCIYVYIALLFKWTVHMCINQINQWLYVCSSIVDMSI